MENNIKSLREEKGKSMKEVASDLGLAYTTYVNYEKGSREPPTKILKALSDYFGCSSDYILGIKNKRLDVSEFAEALFAGCTVPTPNQEDLQQRIEEVLKDNVIDTTDEKQKSPSNKDGLTNFQLTILQLLECVPEDRQDELASLIESALKMSGLLK